MNLTPYQPFLDDSVIPLRLACQTRSGWPVMLSLWYLYDAGALYCATQSSAKIVAHLAADPRCAFEIAADQPPYCGIRGRARAELVPALGGETLERLLTRYLGGTSGALAQKLLRQRATEVAIRLQPVSIYTWDFTRRMADAARGQSEKPCP